MYSVKVWTGQTLRAEPHEFENVLDVDIAGGALAIHHEDGSITMFASHVWRESTADKVVDTAMATMADWEVVE